MSQVHPDAALRELLEGRPQLRLTLIDRDYGMPCPEDRWEVKAAIDRLLKPSLEGMVLGLDVLEDEDGNADDVLIIGVVDLATALPKLRDALKQLHVPAGATLVVDGGADNLAPDLPTRAELVREMADCFIQLLLAECIECAPSDWKTGTLTIQCDGNWIGYKLKNAESRHAASISGRLQALCEELSVLMWNNGNRWREAVLHYEGKDFTIEFSYEESLHPIPRPTDAADAAPAKPWWKLW